MAKASEIHFGNHGSRPDPENSHESSHWFRIISRSGCTVGGFDTGRRVEGAASQAPTAEAAKVISAEDCTPARLGTAIPVAAIGEPVAGVTLAAPRWVAAAGAAPAYCSIDGAMAPTDTSPNGRPINFRVVLPASWTRHAVQLGGGGMNGSIPNLTGGEAANLLQRGFATYGSDSGHQQGGFGPRGGRGGRRQPRRRGIGHSATKRLRTSATCR